MKYFVYNADGIVEYPNQDVALKEIELFNRDNANNRKSFYSGECFPPVGKVFVMGDLRDKTEKEKVESGEISLDVLKADVFKKINENCYNAIVAGFESSALGEVHVYDSEDVDQVNLIGSVAAGGSVLYKCSRNSDGLRDFFTHTNTQIKKVLADGANRKITLLQRCYEMKEAVALLTTYDAVVGFDCSI